MMAAELTIEEYQARYSLFTADELVENRKRERGLLRDEPALIKFWHDKRELFKARLDQRELDCFGMDMRMVK